MPDKSLEDLDPCLKALCGQWLDACAGSGLRVGISQTYRSKEEQDADYAKGRTAPGRIITNAMGGQSPHNCTDADGNPASRAFDFYIYDTDSNALDWDPTDHDWQLAISIGKELGLVSGGDFHSIKDYPHFELPDWKLNT